MTEIRGDVAFLISILVVVLSFLTGFCSGVSIEQQVTIKSLHDRIEQLEAMR